MCAIVQIITVLYLYAAAYFLQLSTPGDQGLKAENLPYIDMCGYLSVHCVDCGLRPMPVVGAKTPKAASPPALVD